jgi:hypothetical protein
MARVGQYEAATSLRDVSDRYEPVTVFRWDNAPHKPFAYLLKGGKFLVA